MGQPIVRCQRMSALIPTVIAKKKKGLTIPRRSWIAQSLLQIIHILSVDAHRWIEPVGHVHLQSHSVLNSYLSSINGTLQRRKVVKRYCIWRRRR